MSLARLIALLLVLVLLAEATLAVESKPNVLFIAVDDLNDWVSPLGGYAGTKTPNLDRLASRSMTFTRAYCSAPACNPSRASLLTGIRPSTSGVYHNNQPWRGAMPDAVTLPQHFLQAGYTVRGGGKIFHGSYPDPESWQEYFAQKRDPGPKEPKKARRNKQEANPRPFGWGPLDAEDSEMPDSKTADWAVEQLTQSAEKPFFLAVGFYKPHLQWYVPQKYFDLYPIADVKRPIVPDDDLDDVPLVGREIAKPRGDHRLIVEGDYWESAVQAYLAAISFSDGQIGRVLEALETGPHAKNTIVVLWGDHGWHLGEKEHWRKFALWEEATRVPLFISVPGVTKSGARCERTVSLLDLYPTLVDLCGLPLREELEGRNIKPLLADAAAEWNHPVVTTHGRDNHAVRGERWRYIRYSDGSEELYDHDADPMEWKNVAKDPQWAEVKSQLASHLPETNARDAATVRDAGE